MSESRDWGVWSNIGFPRGDTSHPLNPDVGLSAAKLQYFFELCKKKVKNIYIYSKIVLMRLF